MRSVAAILLSATWLLSPALALADSARPVLLDQEGLAAFERNVSRTRERPTSERPSTFGQRVQAEARKLREAPVAERRQHGKETSAERRRFEDRDSDRGRGKLLESGKGNAVENRGTRQGREDQGGDSGKRGGNGRGNGRGRD